jgi:hypothetical protein
MKLEFADESLLDILAAISPGSGAGLFWKLFTNDFTPAVGNVLADFTFASATWAELQVAPAAFTITQLAGHQASIQANNIVFTNSGGSIVSVYGYAITNTAKTKIVAATRFDDAPIVMDLLAQLPVTPILGMQSYYASA